MREFDTLDDLGFARRTVLFRPDINLPLERNTLAIEDDTRIVKVIPTLDELCRKKARVVILAHQGRPGSWDFIPLDGHARLLSHHLGREVRYVDDILGEEAEAAIASLEPGQVILLKNVRELPYEMENRSMEEHARSELVEGLSGLVDIFVNDAFAAAHRSHCSLVGFQAVLPSAAGRLMQGEIEAIDTVLKSPKHPSVFVLGGAKFSDAIKMIDRVVGEGIADWVLLTGLCANFFLKARGVNLGEVNEKALESEMTPENLREAKELLARRGNHIILPHDVALDVGGGRREVFVGDLPSEYEILDIGDQTIAKFCKVIRNARTIFMSGPAGMIERDPFAQGTQELMGAVAHSKAFSLLGGGHTVAAANRLGLAQAFSYVSTGGGALESYLIGEPLPVIEALKEAKRRRLR